MILDAPRAALGSETNTNLDVHSRSGRGLQIWSSSSGSSADRCADAKLFPKLKAKPQVTGHWSATASTELQLCTSVRCGAAERCRSSTLEYSNTRARGRDKGSTPKYAAATGHWWCCSCNPMKRTNSKPRTCCLPRGSPFTFTFRLEIHGT